MTPAQIQARIDATLLQLEAYEAASLALGVGGVESYDLDTGQTRQKVTKLNLPAIQRAIDTLTNRCVTLGIRLNGNGGFVGRSAQR